MLQYVFIAMIALAPSFAFSQPAKEGPLARPIDINTSTVKWSGTKKVGGGHNGTIKFLPKSSVTTHQQKFLSGELFIDMHSIVNEDVKDKAMNDKLRGHLKSEDFFSVEKYPEAKFIIKKITEDSPGMYSFSGDLTIRDVTKPETVKAKVVQDGPAYTATGSMKIDRTKYNIKYNSESFFPDLIKTGKDKIINNEFTLDFVLKTVPK